MNRYVADGILADVAAGRRVLFVADTMVGVAAALEEIERRVPDHMVGGLTVRRANGREEISHTSGGRAWFTSVRSTGGRGLSVDVVFVDAVDMTADRLADLIPCVTSSPHGEVMRR